MKNYFASLLFLLSFNGFAQMKPATGTIRYFEKFASAFVTPRNVAVWLPDGYSNKEKYAVLYMHDGQMLFDATRTWNKQEWQADETAAKLMAEGKTKKFIIVGIESLAPLRHSNYFPQQPFESLPQKTIDSLYAVSSSVIPPVFGTKVNSDYYLQFIVKELKPFIDKTFSVKTDRSNTFIAGSSMGGLISMYAICEYPNVFGGAACLSTHWPGFYTTENNPIPTAFLKYLKSHLPSPKNHKIYFDYGDQTLDALYAPFQKQADVIMNEKGFTTKNWETKFFPGEDHSEKAWSKRLGIPFAFLLSK